MSSSVNGEGAEIPRWVVPAVFAFLAAVIYLPPLLSTGLTIDANDQTQTIALLKWTAEEWLSGSVPLWNPFALMGYPEAAGLVAQAFYPPTLLFGIFHPVPAHILYYFLHAALAWIGFYRFSRSHHWRRETSILTTAAYVFGGWMVSKKFAGLALYLAPASILPFLLLFIRRLRQGKPGTAGLAWAGGIFLLSAGPDLVLYGVYLGAAYAVALGLRSSHRRSFFEKLIGAAIIALAIGSVQWLLAFDFLPHTERWAVRGASFAASYFVPLHHLIMILIPSAFGNLALGNYVGAASFVELFCSPGLVVLLGALVSLRYIKQPGRLFWLVIIGLALAASLGPQLPLHRWLAESLPGFSGMRRATRFLYLVSLGLIVLAGYGIDDILRGRTRFRFPMWISFAAVAAALAIGASWSILADLLGKLPGNYFELGRRHAFTFLRYGIIEFLILAASLLLVLRLRISAARRGLLLVLILSLQNLPWALAMHQTKSFAIYFGNRQGLEQLKVPWPGRVSLEQLGALGWYPADLQFHRIPQVEGYAGLFSAQQQILITRYQSAKGEDKERLGELMGIRFRIGADTMASVPGGWHVALSRDDGVILERDTPPCGAWRQDAQGEMIPLEIERVSAREFFIPEVVSGSRIIISEIYDRGWTCASSVRLEPWEGALLSFVPTSSGSVVLRYQPHIFLVGVYVSAFGWLAAMVLTTRCFFAKGRSSY